LLNWREDIIKQCRIQFGYNIMRNGSMNPSMFNSPEKFDRLLNLIEADLLLMWESYCERHRRHDVVAFKSHILLERGWKDRFDFVVNVYRPQKKRIADISKLKGITEAEAMVLSSQEMGEVDKGDASDYVIHNYDSLSLLTQFEAMRKVMHNGWRKASASLPRHSQI